MNIRIAGHVDATVKVGDGVVSIRRVGISVATVARLLGRQLSEDGTTESLTLDRLVHRPHEQTIGRDGVLWSLHGAYVSVLHRKVAQVT